MRVEVVVQPHGCTLSRQASSLLGNDVPLTIFDCLRPPKGYHIKMRFEIDNLSPFGISFGIFFGGSGERRLYVQSLW